MQSSLFSDENLHSNMKLMLNKLNEKKEYLFHGFPAGLVLRTCEQAGDVRHLLPAGGELLARQDGDTAQREGHEV